jgi:hypothetical protein
MKFKQKWINNNTVVFITSCSVLFCSCKASIKCKWLKTDNNDDGDNDDLVYCIHNKNTFGKHTST